MLWCDTVAVCHVWKSFCLKVFVSLQWPWLRALREESGVTIAQLIAGRNEPRKQLFSSRLASATWHEHPVARPTLTGPTEGG